MAQGPSAGGQLERVGRLFYQKEPLRPIMKEDLGSGSFIFFYW